MRKTSGPQKPRLQVPVDVAPAFLRHTETLAGGPVAQPMASWLADNFNKNFDAYDQAIDAVYNSTHIGGPRYHHLLDGQHTLWGALGAVKNVDPDDSFSTRLAEVAEHLLRDTMSVSGTNPFLSPSAFESIADLGSSLGISRAYLADAMTVNGPELLGGGIALVGALAIGRKAEPETVSLLSGSYVVTALASGNPVLLPIGACGLIYSLAKSDDKKSALREAGKGALVSGSALLAGSLVGGPLWLGCVTTILTGVAVKYALDQPEKALARTKQTVKAAKHMPHQGSYALKDPQTLRRAGIVEAT